MTFADNSKTLTCRQIIEYWRDDARFRRFFDASLGALPHAAFFWEVRPISCTLLDAPFECVAVDSPELHASTADPEPFGARIGARATADGIAVFDNLGGDAQLIAPCTNGAGAAYAHLAAFVRHGPVDQRDALWARVGAAMTERVGPEPLWLSTSGLGVRWLHVRLDRQPKYITYAPYRRLGRGS